MSSNLTACKFVFGFLGFLKGRGARKYRGGRGGRGGGLLILLEWNNMAGFLFTLLIETWRKSSKEYLDM